jgi:hypothetical protein
MGSKKSTFSCLVKASLYQTPYSNFTTSFFNIFYYFIYIYIFFFTTPKIPSFLIFLFPLSLSLPLFPLFSPHFFSSVSLSSVPARGVFSPLPLSSCTHFLLFPDRREPITGVRRPARTHTHRFKVVP